MGAKPQSESCRAVSWLVLARHLLFIRAPGKPNLGALVLFSHLVPKSKQSRCLQAALPAPASAGTSYPLTPPSCRPPCPAQSTPAPVMAAAAAARVLALLQGARRPAAFTAAAAATGARPAAALRSAGNARLAPLARRLGALHGAAVVCSAAGDGEPAMGRCWRGRSAPRTWHITAGCVMPAGCPQRACVMQPAACPVALPRRTQACWR